MGRERSELLRQIRELQMRLMIMDNARRAQDPLDRMGHNYLFGRMAGRTRAGALFEYQRMRDAMIAARAEQGWTIIQLHDYSILTQCYTIFISMRTFR